MRILVRILISSFLAAVTIFGCSILAFASEETPEQVPEGFSWVDQDQVKVLEFSEKAAAATTYTTTDIYNLLSSAMGSPSSSTTYSLPYLAYRTNQIYTRTGTISTTLTQIFDSLAGNGSAYNVLDSLYYQTQSGNTVSASELLAYIWVHSDNIDSALSSSLPFIQTALSNIDSSVDSVKSSVDSVNTSVSTGFTQLQSSLDQISWTTYTSSLTISSSPSSVVTPVAREPIYYIFTIPITSTETVYNFRLPYRVSAFYTPQPSDFEIGYIYQGNAVPIDRRVELVDYNALNSLLDIYVSDTRFYITTSPSTYMYYIKYTPSSTQTPVFNYSPAQFRYIQDSSIDYYTVYGWLRSRSDSDQLDKLVNALAPDKFVEAEAASEQVIDQALDDFTGNGAGAAKVSDSAAMSSVSGSVQSGLDTGASVSNATSVFNIGSDFWGWFTQSNSDFINNPYPAPSYVQTRGSGDEVVDFLSGNDIELRDLLGGD